jgi:hypothetical protein
VGARRCPEFQQIGRGDRRRIPLLKPDELAPTLRPVSGEGLAGLKAYCEARA